MKLKFILVLSIVSINLFSCAKQSLKSTNILREPSSRDTLFPQISSDVHKLKVLLAIQKEVPEIFSDASRFDVDIFAILEDQAKLQDLLQNYPEYIKLWKKKVFVDISVSIQTTKENSNQTKKIKAREVLRWKRDLKKHAQLLIDNNLSLAKTVGDRISDLENYSSAGFLNGLILNLPQGLQADARQLQKDGNWGKLEKYLIQNLPEEVSNFRTSIAEKSLKKSALIEKWKKIIVNEKANAPLLDLFFLSKNYNLELPQLFEKISSFDQQDILNLADVKYQKMNLRYLQGPFKIPPYYQQYLKSFTSQTQTVREKIAKVYSLTIKEKNPIIAIFRGFPAGDCSSQYSFPYPNDPNERVFYIYDQNHKIKGSLSTTMVTTEDGKKSLYAISIAGKRINAEDTKMIFQALYRERTALGVDSIIVPTIDRIEKLMNFIPIREVYNSISNAGVPVKINYALSPIRKSIEEFTSQYNHGEFDHEKSNTEGVKFIPTQDTDLLVETNLVKSSGQGDVFISSTKIELTSLIEFKLSLLKSGRTLLADKVLSIALSPDQEDEVNKLISLMMGNESLSTREINSYVDDFIKNFSLDEKQANRIKRSYLFIAYLGATDAKEEPYYSENMKRLLQDFNYNSAKSVVPRNKLVYEKWKNDLLDNSSFEKLRAPYIEALSNEAIAPAELISDNIRVSIALAKPVDIKKLTDLGKLSELDFENISVASLFNEEMVSTLLKKASSEDQSFLLSVFLPKAIFTSSPADKWKNSVYQFIHLAKEKNYSEPLERLTLNGMYEMLSMSIPDRKIWIHNFLHLISVVRTSPSLMVHDEETQKMSSKILENIINYPIIDPDWRKCIEESIKAAEALGDEAFFNKLSSPYYFKKLPAEWNDLLIDIMRVAKKNKYENTLSNLINLIPSMTNEASKKTLLMEVIKAAQSLQSNNLMLKLSQNTVLLSYFKGLEYSIKKLGDQNENSTKEKRNKNWDALQKAIEKTEGKQPRLIRNNLSCEELVGALVGN